MDWIYLAQNWYLLGGCCKHGFELFVFYEFGEILYWLINYLLRRNNCTPWNWLLN